MELNRIYNENCLTTLERMPKGLIKCCVTSPPYYGLRDYGTGKWIGGDENCDHKGAPMRTKAFINQNISEYSDIKNADSFEPFKDVCGKCGAKRVDEQIGLEETPELYIARLVEVFHLLKEKMADDGTLWLNIGDSYAAYWGQKYGQGQSLSGTRENNGSAPPSKKSPNFDSDIKPKDLFGIPWLLAFALRADGWYLRQDIIWHKPNPMPESVTDRCTKSHEYLFLLSKSAKYYYNADAIKEPVKSFDNIIRDRETTKLNNVPGRTHMNGLTKNQFESANKRSVWTVTTKPFLEAHFATFPPDLIVPCIKAGSAEGDVIYDPFMGAGTTAMVSLKLGRKFIGSEINSEYIKIAEKRIQPFLHNLFT